MAGRALAFSDSEIVRLAREAYVAVACDDWYQRRRRDAEGEFFMSVAKQGPRKGERGDTQQGIYVATASGKLLAYKNAGQSPEAMRELLREGLAKWKRLPASERAPGAITVSAHGHVDRDYHREPPRDGLIIKVYARALDREKPALARGAAPATGAAAQSKPWLFADAECTVGSGDEASRDHLWLTEAEWQSLIPEQPQAGTRFPLPPKIAERILRFHLVDNTRGEPPMWRRDEIHANDFELIVERVTSAKIELRLQGAALLATDRDAQQAARGYQPTLVGFIEYDRSRQRLTRFDVVAVGDQWGSGPFTRSDARPGRTPLGVAFELSSGDSPADRIAPQGARELNEYFGR